PKRGMSRSGRAHRCSQANLLAPIRRGVDVLHEIAKATWFVRRATNDCTNLSAARLLVSSGGAIPGGKNRSRHFPTCWSLANRPCFQVEILRFGSNRTGITRPPTWPRARRLRHEQHGVKGSGNIEHRERVRKGVAEVSADFARGVWFAQPVTNR